MHPHTPIILAAARYRQSPYVRLGKTPLVGLWGEGYYSNCCVRLSKGPQNQGNTSGKGTNMSHNRFALDLSSLPGLNDVRRLNQKICAASEAGYYGISLRMADVEAWVKSGKRIEQLLQTVSGLGMEIVELCDVKMFDERGRLADCANEFAVATALEIPLVSAVYNKDTDDLTKARADWAHFCDLTRNVEGLEIGLHFKGDAKHFNTLDSAWDITSDGPANGRIVLDVFDFWRGGSPANSLEMVPLDMLGMVHVTDVATVHRFQAKESDRAVPGTGVMPLTHIVSALSRRGYSGMFSVEICGDAQKGTYAQIAADAYRATRRLLGTSGPSHRKVAVYAESRA